MAYKKSAPYRPGQKSPFIISRSKIELFMQCQRCFWLEARMGIKRPSGPPFQINKAIDELFKKEFDTYRTNKKPHPIMEQNGLKAIPYAHKDLDVWRDTFTGIRTLHTTTNLEVFGGIDDVWIDEEESLIVVDYKATAKAKEVTLDADWQQSYKRQLEVYQWLLRANDFTVSNTGYFVYTNALYDGDSFNDHLSFTTKLIAHEGTDSWIEPTLVQIKDRLEGSIPPVGDSIMGGVCEYCSYAKSRTELTLAFIKKTQA